MTCSVSCWFATMPWELASYAQHLEVTRLNGMQSLLMLLVTAVLNNENTCIFPIFWEYVYLLI